MIKVEDYHLHPALSKDLEKSLAKFLELEMTQEIKDYLEVEIKSILKTHGYNPDKVKVIISDPPKVRIDFEVID